MRNKKKRAGQGTETARAEEAIVNGAEQGTDAARAEKAIVNDLPPKKKTPEQEKQKERETVTIQSWKQRLEPKSSRKNNYLFYFNRLAVIFKVV